MSELAGRFGISIGLTRMLIDGLQPARDRHRFVIGQAYFAPVRVDEFVASRIVEAVVHGIDLTQAPGRDYIATTGGIIETAAMLDDLLARRTVGRRPRSCRTVWNGSGARPAGARTAGCRSSGEDQDRGSRFS